MNIVHLSYMYMNIVHFLFDTATRARPHKIPDSRALRSKVPTTTIQKTNSPIQSDPILCGKKTKHLVSLSIYHTLRNRHFINEYDEDLQCPPFFSFLNRQRSHLPH